MEAAFLPHRAAQFPADDLHRALHYVKIVCGDPGTRALTCCMGVVCSVYTVDGDLVLLLQTLAVEDQSCGFIDISQDSVGF